MNEMLDNRDFEPGAESAEDVTPVEENNDVTPSSDTEEVEPQETKVPEESVEIDVEETTEKTQTEETENPEESGEPTEETPSLVEKPTRAQKRIQKLVAENNALKQKSQQADPTPKKVEINSLTPNDDGEIELTPTQLNEYIAQQVESNMTSQRETQIAQEKADAWDEDIADLMEGNPMLNPKSPDFNKELNDSLIDIIRVANTDDNGNPVVKKLPSEIWAGLNKTINSAKSAGTKDASVNLAKKAEESAVQNTAEGVSEDKKYSDEELVTLQMKDPRAYAQLIEDNII